MSRCQEIPLHTQLKTGKLSLPISPSRHFFVRRSIRRRMESQSGRTEAANFPQTLHSFVHERRSKLICSHSKSKIYSRYWKRRKTLTNTRELVTNEKRCKTRDNDPCEGSAGAACYVTLSFKTANLRLAVCKCARHLFERGNGKGKQKNGSQCLRVSGAHFQSPMSATVKISRSCLFSAAHARVTHGAVGAAALHAPCEISNCRPAVNTRVKMRANCEIPRPKH